MTVLEINNRLTVLESEVLSLSKERYQLEKVVDANVKEVLRPYLKAYNVFTDGFTLGERSSRNICYISRTREENRYEKDEMTIYLDRETLEPSFYTTSEVSKYELERMVLIGKIGTMLLERGDIILEAINQVRDEYKEQITNLSTLLWEKEKEISELRRRLVEIKKEAIFNKTLDEGVEFIQDVKSGGYKRVTVGRYNLYNLKKLKAVLVGRGGFCDLEVTYADDVKTTFNRVKTQDLKEALTCNSERIIS